MKVNEENIGKAFKEALNDYEVQPDPQVWQNIRQLTPAQNPFTSMVAKFFYLASFVAVVGVGLYLGLNKDVEADKQIAESTQTSIENTTIETIPVVDPTPENKELADPTSDSNQPESTEDEQVITSPTESTPNLEESTSITNSTDNNSTVANQNPSANQDPYAGLQIDIEPEVAEQDVEVEPEFIAFESEETELERVPEFSPKFGDNPTICFGTDAYLNVEDGFDYKWNTGEFSNTIKVSPAETKSYFVTVTNPQGQSVVHEFTVEVDKSCRAVLIPSAFSPNGDLSNDELLAIGENITNFSMTILNRQSQTVFHSTNINEGWDGTFRNEDQPVGVYVCIITYVDGRGVYQKISETVTLVR
jgi:gliding motility-associated-like protein